MNSISSLVDVTEEANEESHAPLKPCDHERDNCKNSQDP